MKRKRIERVIASILAVCMGMNTISWQDVRHVSASEMVVEEVQRMETEVEMPEEKSAETGSPPEMTVKNQEVKGQIVETEDAETEETSTKIQEERSESLTVYDLGDGRKKAVIYGSEVRFTNEDGELTEYDASLVPVESKVSLNGESLEGYAYENKVGDRKQYLPEHLSEQTPGYGRSKIMY